MKFPKFKKIMRKVIYYSTLHIETSKIASHDITDDNINQFKTPKIRTKKLEGGENTMTKPMRNTTKWDYETAEAVLSAAYRGFNPAEISEQLKGVRNENAVRVFIANFNIWMQNESSPVYISKTAKKYFERYVAENPNNIPNRSNKVTENKTEASKNTDLSTFYPQKIEKRNLKLWDLTYLKIKILYSFYFSLLTNA